MTDAELLDNLIELTLRISEAPRDKIVAPTTSARWRHWRDAIWLIARDDYNISAPEIARHFGASRRSVVSACCKARKDHGTVHLLRLRMARLLHDLNDATAVS